jgi:polyphosphate kinase 2 (PPK2 family)
LVERVEGYATPTERRRAYNEINEFERMLLEYDTRLVKIFLHLTPEEQMDRFRARLTIHRNAGDYPTRIFVTTVGGRTMRRRLRT